MSDRTLFTSESVTEGHPDKIADQVSDSVLDTILAQDPMARVACETMLTTGLCVVAGEITTTAVTDITSIVRRTILDIGYDDATKGLDGRTCAVLVSLDKQSPDIAGEWTPPSSTAPEPAARTSSTRSARVTRG